jgi:hypothetical protein
MSTTKLKPLLSGALFVSLCACTSLPVITDSNPNASVSSCHTYIFAREQAATGAQPTPFGNPLNGERLRNAIAANLAAKGIQPAADRAHPDCAVGYAMGTRQVFSDYYGGYGYGLGWGYGWGRRGYGGWGYRGGAVVSDETRISMDLFDARSRVPIWHAAVSLNASDVTGADAEKHINLGVAAIFGKFPILMAVPPGRTSS